jgi:hypothetical protein
MKKIFLTLSSIFILLLSTPVFAQLEDPGADPDTPAAPIDGYVWVLAIVGLIYVFLRLRAFVQQGNLPRK